MLELLGMVGGILEATIAAQCQSRHGSVDSGSLSRTYDDGLGGRRVSGNERGVDSMAVCTAMAIHPLTYLPLLEISKRDRAVGTQWSLSERQQRQLRLYTYIIPLHIKNKLKYLLYNCVTLFVSPLLSLTRRRRAVVLTGSITIK